MNDAEYHIAVIDGQIRDPQGRCQPAFTSGEHRAPAGNTFSVCDTTLIGEPHLHRNSSASGFRYNHHNLAGYIPDSSCISNGVLTRPCATTTPSCLSRILTAPPSTPGAVISIYNTCIICVNDTIDIHRSGLHSDWENLREMANGYSLLAAAMKDSLAHQGNRLPDEILLDAIVKKQENNDDPFFSDVQLRDILISNAPNTYRVMKAVREREPALSGDVLPQIEAAQDSPATGRLDTMRIIQDMEHLQTLIYNEWIRYAIDDDSNDLSVLDVIDSLKLEEEPQLRAKLVELYLMEDSLEAAREALDAIPLYDSEMQEFHRFFSMKLDLADESKTWLDADNDQIEKLWDITETSTRAAIQARNILRILEDTTFTEVVGEIETVGYKRGKENQWIEESGIEETSAQHIRLYPNPAKDELIIEYDLEEPVAKFIIYNAVGQEQIILVLKGKEGKKTLNVSHLPEGVHLYKVSANKSLLQEGKITILR